MGAEFVASISFTRPFLVTPELDSVKQMDQVSYVEYDNAYLCCHLNVAASLRLAKASVLAAAYSLRDSFTLILSKNRLP